MVFVFDLDDTICETDGFSELYMSHFFKTNNLPYNQIDKVVRFAEMKYDWSHEDALSWYKQYGDEMMRQFPLKKGAREVINRLYDNGHKIVFATARANDWHSDPVGITNEWLKKSGLKFHEVYIGRCDKEEICKLENADVFVDDDIKTVSRVSEFFKNNKKSGQAYLATTANNKEFEIPEGVKRMSSFLQLLKIADKEKE